ncbi:MAG: ABC transporter ATP-binding protein [Cyanobacteria bacterium J06621_11]
MSDTIIRVEGLGKKYSIRHEKREKYVALRDVFANTVSRLKRKITFSDQLNSQPQEDFWALQDVSFEVKQGDVVGIIGHNGAGKSTLLKILSRITEPTKGVVELRGKVASLLEVGTGFHPELTGRENISLNGAILGMCKAEITRKFDEIVYFAGVEKFLDTPVKRYSSGMYVRLAFAVAAHLEPEILVIDEVLAVGDSTFQKKCFGKMNSIAKGGRTVILVSHNMSAIQNLCKHSIHLSQGNLVEKGKTDDVIHHYLEALEKEEQCIPLEDIPRKSGLGELIRITQCTLQTSQEKKVSTILFGAPFSILVEAMPVAQLYNLSLIIQIESFQREIIVTSSSELSDLSIEMSKNKRMRILASFTDLLLMPGKYWITVGIRQGKTGLDQIRHAKRFEVSEISSPGHNPHPATWGYVQALPIWEIK